jgi:hypothetical protein
MSDSSDFEITGRDMLVGMGIGGWDMEWTVLHKPSGTSLTYQTKGSGQHKARSEALALLEMFVDAHYPGDQAVAGAALPPMIRKEDQP